MVEEPEVGEEVKGSLAILSLLAILLVSIGPGSVSALSLAPASSAHPLKGNITGPTVLPVTGQGTYVLEASGGPAELANGTVKGNYTYNATIIGINTTGGLVSPATGTLTNGTADLTLTGPNNTGNYILNVNVTSKPDTGNSTSIIVSYNFTTVVPYVLSDSLDNHNSFAITGARVIVGFDGSTVATITLPSIAANGTYDFVYNYTTSAGLSSGYHTFTLTISGTSNLLTFSNGQTQLSVTFYVQPPATDYTWYYAIGALLVALAIFISLFVVGGGRRRKKR